MRAWVVAASVALGAAPAVAQDAPSATARWDTASFWSQSLGVRKRLLVRLPASYDRTEARRYPVVYYLHGRGGDEESYARDGLLDRTLDSLAAAGREVLVVTPDGDDGWYTTWNSLGDWPGCRRSFTPNPRRRDTPDTFCVPWLHYDDYIARDLVSFVDRTWRTEARRDRRAIAGISMGGYGALAIGLGYPEVFAAIAAHSAVASPLYVGSGPFTLPPAYARSGEELQRAWGDFWAPIVPVFGADTAGWWSRDPARRARSVWTSRKQLMPALHVDVGLDDPLLGQNRALRHELSLLRVPFTYREWPGSHDDTYWRAHVGAGVAFTVLRITGG